MKKYLIEREIPGVDQLKAPELKQAATVSNTALAKLSPRVQWVESYVTKDRTFCVYLAEDESAVHEHATLSGFPATKVTEIVRMIDPTTAAA